MIYCLSIILRLCITNMETLKCNKECDHRARQHRQQLWHYTNRENVYKYLIKRWRWRWRDYMYFWFKFLFLSIYSLNPYVFIYIKVTRFATIHFTLFLHSSADGWRNVRHANLLKSKSYVIWEFLSGMSNNSWYIHFFLTSFLYHYIETKK